MAILSPDIETFKQNLDSTITSIENHKANSHSAIRIEALLNISVYVLATRFLEGSVKHIVMSCCKMKGYTSEQFSDLESELKKFNNPEFANIRELFKTQLEYDIISDLHTSFSPSDITFLNQIVQNRHRNVHASPDSTEWYNQNKKDLNNFKQEYPCLIKIVEYLTSLEFNEQNDNVNLTQSANPRNNSNPSNTPEPANKDNVENTENRTLFERIGSSLISFFVK